MKKKLNKKICDSIFAIFYILGAISFLILDKSILKVSYETKLFIILSFIAIATIYRYASKKIYDKSKM